MIDVNWDLAPEGAMGVAQRGKQLAFVDNDRNIFIDDHWGISMEWKLVAKRPTFAESITKKPQLTQTKTVADAVEYFGGVWPESKYVTAWWDSECEQILLGDNVTSDTICTRDEFEAYVKEQDDFVAKAQGDFVSNEEQEYKSEYPPLTQSLIDEAEQEGEKWAHGIPPNGIYCRVLHKGEVVNCYLIGRDDMGAFVYRIDGEYHATSSETNFRPIKPKITEAEAWRKLCEMEHDSVYAGFAYNSIIEQYEVIS